MKEEEWERLTNCEKLRYRICDLDVSESTSNKLAFELANIEDEISELQEENEMLNNECDTYMKIATKKQERIDKAIKILKHHDHEYAGAVYSALNILQGEDK